MPNNENQFLKNEFNFRAERISLYKSFHKLMKAYPYNENSNDKTDEYVHNIELMIENDCTKDQILKELKKEDVHLFLNEQDENV